MFVETDLPRKVEPFAADRRPLDLENPDPKGHFFDKGGEKPPKAGATNPQELTLSYLCDHPKLGLQEKESSGKNFLGSLEKFRCKGKEIVSEPPPPGDDEDRRYVERDFLQLNGGACSKVSSKREVPEGADGCSKGDGREKKAKLETLNLSLGLPNLSLSLNSSPPVPSAAPPAAPVVPAIAPAPDPPLSVPARRTQSNNTRASSDDFAASRSYSYSLPFSHNPSCSMTHNSTDNYEYSRETDHIWYAGEGTNGSVHSRFKPVGETIANSNNISFSTQNGFPRLPNDNKEANNSLHRANSLENCSFFPSELPARQRRENAPVSSDGGRHIGLLRPERILREIVSESVPVVAQILQELPSDSVEAIKEYLRNIMNTPEKKEEIAILQRRLERRSDITFETLLKSQKTQLDILVTVKTGLGSFLSGKNRLPTSELVEIFLLSRCRNVNCKSVLPVDDCDCKICSTKKGFCSACMCPICLNFDCAANTCSWVGCDVCSHWCHAMCGIQKNLIRPGPRVGGAAGTTEMQFYCIGCGHASEMFGFVKEVFICCAKDWGLETLTKELDCVRKIFRGSEDFRGKELHRKAVEMLEMLDKKLISPVDACNNVLQFLKYGNSELSSSATATAAKDGIITSQKADVHPLLPSATTHSYNLNSSGGQRDIMKDVKNIDLKALEPESPFVTPKNQDGFESLESIVRFKEAEAKLFQRLADDARKEVEGYCQIARAKSDQLEEEYAAKLAKLRLQETEERRRKKLEELKMLENSHIDYYNMKLRMQAEIGGLLERMEATKQQWV